MVPGNMIQVILTIKSPIVTLTKKVEELYDINFKMLKKETEESIRRWKALPYLWIGRINIIKMTNLPKKSTNSMQLPIKFQHNSSYIMK